MLAYREPEDNITQKIIGVGIILFVILCFCKLIKYYVAPKDNVVRERSRDMRVPSRSRSRSRRRGTSGDSKIKRNKSRRGRNMGRQNLYMPEQWIPVGDACFDETESLEDENFE